MDQAASSKPPQRTTAFVARTALYTTALTLSVLGWYVQPLGIPGPDWVRNLLLALPIFLAIILEALPSIIFRGRLVRLKVLGRRAQILPARYFRLAPYTNTQLDRESYQRPDEEHKKVFEWLLYGRQRLYYLTGRSGTGKSSLLDAHVLPGLSGPPHFWKILTLHAGPDPLSSLGQALVEPGRIWEHPPTAVKDLNMLLARACGQTKYPLLIVWDQFEEFLIHNDEGSARRQAFTSFIQRMTQDGPDSLKILLVFRSDYLRSFFNLELPALEAQKNWEEVSPFLPDDARDFLHKSELGISHRLLDHILHEIYEIEETKGLVRPVTLNMIGLVLANSSKSERAHLDYEHGMMSLMVNNLRAALYRPSIRRFAPGVIRPMLTEDGTKQDRTVAELAWESGTDPEIVRGCLVDLANQSLVRRLDPITERWTISHDFVAKQLDLILRTWRPHIFRRWRMRLLFSLLLLWTVTVFAILPVLDSSFKDRNIANIVRQGGEVIDGEKGVSVRFRSHPRLDRTTAYLKKVDRFYRLDLSRTQVTDLTALQGLPELKELSLEGAANADLETLTNLPGLQSLNLSNLPIKEIVSLQRLQGLRELDLSASGVEHLTAIAGYPNLTHLHMRNSGVRSEKRKQASVDFNQLSLQELMRVDVSPENVPYLTELRDAHWLTWLDFRSTYVSSLGPLTALRRLEGLELADTRVEDLAPLAKLPKLHHLDLRGTRITDLQPLAGLANLKTLLLSRNKVADLTALGKLSQLTELDLGRSDVADLEPLRSLSALQKLDLSYTYVQDIEPISQLEHLETLDLGGSSVSQIAKIGSLARLKSLSLAETGVVNLSALSPIQSLRHLDLSRTSIRDLYPLYSLRGLETLNLTGTQVTRDELLQLRQALPKVHITKPSGE